MRKKVLVTGGSGFIGQHLITQLMAKEYSVSCLDRHIKTDDKKIKIFQGDITDPEIVATAVAGQDLIFHLAGILGTSELQDQAIAATQINVVGALNIFQAAVKAKAAVVLISKPNPWLNTYSITKETSEKFCKLYEKEFGLKAVIVKWFSVYGPGQKFVGVQKAVPTFIVKALRGEPLPVFGTGKQTADFIYVSDAVDATIAVSEQPDMYGKTVEIGSGVGTPIAQLAKKIISLTGSRSKVKLLPMRRGEDINAHIVANIDLLHSVSSYDPHINLTDGLTKTIAYYQEIIKEKNSL